MMKKDVKVMNGYELMKADVNVLNKFVEKCAPVWHPVFANEFQKDDFDIIKYTKKMSEVIDNLRYQMTLKKLDGYKLEDEINDFIENEDITKYESNDMLVGCMYLMATQQVIMESVLNKTDINEEMYVYNLVKGFTFSIRELNMESALDMSLIPVSDNIKMTIESLITEEDRKYVRF